LKGHVVESLPEILVFELGILGRTLGAVGIESCDFNDAPHREAKVPQARLAVHGAGVTGDAVEGDRAGKLTNRGAGAREESAGRHAGRDRWAYAFTT
jgi:hypothetical protein